MVQAVDWVLQEDIYKNMIAKADLNDYIENANLNMGEYDQDMYNIENLNIEWNNNNGI